MGDTLDGTVFSASLWGGNGINMSWLDGMTGCKEQCNLDNAKMSMSNFRLDSLDKPNPPPPTDKYKCESNQCVKSDTGVDLATC